MAKRIINIVTLCLCGFIVLLPLLFFDTTKTVSRAENKALAGFPNNIELFDKTVNEQLENWFNDHVGFKEEAIVLNIAAKYKLFHKLDVPNYIEGKNGEVFYIPGDGNPRTWLTRLNDTQIDNIAKTIISVDVWFKAMNIPFYYVGIPDADSVYPENLPNNLKINDFPKAFEKIFSKLDSNTNAIYVKDDLIEAKSQFSDLYYRTYDPTHYNKNGAYVTYGAIMEKILLYLPKLFVPSLDDYTVTAEKTPGTLKAFETFPVLSDVMQFRDSIYNYTPVGDVNWTVTNEKPVILSSETVWDSSYSLFLHNEQMQNGKSLLLMGDSYTQSFLTDFFVQSFENVYFIGYHNTGAETVNELLSQAAIDCAIWIMVERSVIEPNFSNLSVLSRFSVPQVGIEVNFAEPLPAGQYELFYGTDSNFSAEYVSMAILLGGETSIDFFVPELGWNTLRLDFPQVINEYDITGIKAADEPIRVSILGTNGSEYKQAESIHITVTDAFDPFVMFELRNISS